MATPRQFQGGVFAPELPGGRAGARIEVLPDSLRASTPDHRVYNLPYGSMDFELGGSSGRMLFCRNPTRTITIFCEERGFIFALTSEAGHHLNTKFAPVRTQLRDRLLGRIAVTALFVAAIAGLIWGLPPLVRASLRSGVRAVPVSVDAQVGAVALQAMDLGGPEIHDPTLDAALGEMLRRLQVDDEAKVATFPLHVVQSERVNAFALPGGPLVVYTGLLAKAARPEQVAGVMAHEMGHVLHRHGLQRIAQSMGIVATVQFFFGDVGGVLALGRELLTTAAINHYGRADEADADRVAVHLMHAGGLNPLALADLFRTLQADDITHPGAAPVLQWVDDHPALPDRIEHVTREASRLGPHAATPLAVDWPAVQARLREPR
ncbi:MAG TPA: M48 family metallopeptidase [Myxococcota bacterium]|nr:M48 family metallopeptidase [Myxococcota bacterium]